MDWKEILSKKIEDGDLEREDFTPVEAMSVQIADTLHVLIDRKGRKGKTATIIEGFTCPEEEVATIASRLKTKLGTGGSVRGGEILIQGDVAERVKGLLRELGYRVK